MTSMGGRGPVVEDTARVNTRPHGHARVIALGRPIRHPRRLSVMLDAEMAERVRALAEGPPRRPLSWVVRELLERGFAASPPPALSGSQRRVKKADR